MIFNLAINSCDAMPEGGRLEVGTENVELETTTDHRGGVPELGSYVRLYVKDDGHGMTDETRAHMFEPFFTTKKKSGGTGLGLATVYGIVRQSGGHVVVESQPGQGSTFNVYLPRVEEEAGVGAEPVVQLVKTEGEETILVAEDEASVRELACDYLRSRGYRVLEAGNGVEAIRLFEEHGAPIHLLVTDVVMPEIGGQSLARTISARCPNVKVIYMSGYMDVPIEQGEGPGGLNVVLTKPFSMKDLGRVVREALEGRAVPGLRPVLRCSVVTPPETNAVDPRAGMILPASIPMSETQPHDADTVLSDDANKRQRCGQEQVSIWDLLATSFSDLHEPSCQRRYEELLSTRFCLEDQALRSTRLDKVEKQLRSLVKQVWAETRLQIAQHKAELIRARFADSFELESKIEDERRLDDRVHRSLVEHRIRFGGPIPKRDDDARRRWNDVRRQCLVAKAKGAKASISTQRGIWSKLRSVWWKGRVRLHLWWLLWGLVVLTLGLSALLALVHPLVALVATVIAWFVQHYLLNPILDRSFLQFTPTLQKLRPFSAGRASIATSDPWPRGWRPS